MTLSRKIGKNERIAGPKAAIKTKNQKGHLVQNCTTPHVQQKSFPTQLRNYSHLKTCQVDTPKLKHRNQTMAHVLSRFTPHLFQPSHGPATLSAFKDSCRAFGPCASPAAFAKPLRAAKPHSSRGKMILVTPKNPISKCRYSYTVYYWHWASGYYQPKQCIVILRGITQRDSI